MRRNAIPWLFLFSLYLISCSKIEKLSPIPEIEFLSFEIVNSSTGGLSSTTGLLEFDFVDGDADLGVYDDVNADSTLPDSMRFGLFAYLYEKVGGVYQEIIIQILGTNGGVIDTVNFFQHIPYDQKLDRVGQNKTVKGTIRIELLKFAGIGPDYDTLMIEFFIRDRALNKSNVERTNDFVSPESGI
jgi:hypothetical protein